MVPDCLMMDYCQPGKAMVKDENKRKNLALVLDLRTLYRLWHADRTSNAITNHQETEGQSTMTEAVSLTIMTALAIAAPIVVYFNMII